MLKSLTIALMIFVNYGGGKYYFFKHAPWNGLTVADLVFPWFLWIMGLSLCFSINSQFRRGIPNRAILCKIIKRSFVLFALGIIVNCLKSNYLPEFRIPGVLQRFSICYFAIAFLEAICWKPIEETPQQSGLLPWLGNIYFVWPQLISISIIIVVHTILTFFLPLPNCPKGYLGPGGMHADGKFSSCTGGAAAFIDKTIFSENHLYKRPSSYIVYDSSGPFDPEGLLGSLTSCFTVFLGTIAGRIILYYPHHSQRIFRFIVCSLILGICGGCLCNWSKESGLIPVNKNLWSLSFTLVTSSFAFLLLALVYFWVDSKEKWGGTIFRIAGVSLFQLSVHLLEIALLPSWLVHLLT